MTWFSVRPGGSIRLQLSCPPAWGLLPGAVCRRSGSGQATGRTPLRAHREGRTMSGETDEAKGRINQAVGDLTDDNRT